MPNSATYEHIVQQQKKFFNAGNTHDLASRVRQLRLLKRIINTNEGILYEAIQKDFSKSKFDTYTTELAILYQDIDEAIANLSRWAKPTRVGTNWANFPAKSYILKEPLGVCLVIGAWNYPYQLSLAPAIAAIAAGCTVVIKPSELPAYTSAAMADLINKNFDPAWLCVVQGGVHETTQLLEQAWNKIFFTGSVPVGKIVYQAAAKNLVPVALELGGKSPAVVVQDCNLKITAKRLVWAKFLNSGQTCIAPDYVLVHISIAPAFIAAISEEVVKQSFTIQNGNYVQIINDRNVERLAALIDPEKVVLGGHVDVENRIIEPTILYPSSFQALAMQDEIFGPILPVITYENIETAMEEIKQRPKPLSAYIFTSNARTRDTFLNEVSFGGGSVNDAVMHIANSKLPFGGVGHSGIGAYHGKAGFDCFSHSKSILQKSTLIEPNLKYYPHTEGKLTWIKRILKLG